VITSANAQGLLPVSFYKDTTTLLDGGVGNRNKAYQKTMLVYLCTYTQSAAMLMKILMFIILSKFSSTGTLRMAEF